MLIGAEDYKSASPTPRAVPIERYRAAALQAAIVNVLRWNCLSAGFNNL